MFDSSAERAVSSDNSNTPPPVPGELSQTLLLRPLYQQATQQNSSDSTTLDMTALQQRRPPPPPEAAGRGKPLLLPGTTSTSRRRMRTPSPSLLGTLEFKIYYLAYLIVVPNMIYTMYRASSPLREEYKEYEKKLSSGWMLGRMMDLTDGQWSTFRANLPAFTGAMLAYVVLNRIFKAFSTRGNDSRRPQNLKVTQRMVLPALWFPCLFATCFVIVLSGTSTVFILGLTFGNYALAKAVGRKRWAPLVFWAYNMAMLFANENYRGYEFRRIAESLAWLDEWRGILRRWDVTFNLTMLRMMSFSMDYHWRLCQERALTPQQIDALSANRRSEKDRIEHSCVAADYSFANYWAYLMYPPLYLTGPIITFNNFIAQMRYPPQGISRKTTAIYGARLVASLLLMELILHTVYCVAISKWGHWDTFSAYEISLFGYMRLSFIWLKLLIIWRFARFWAMADGLETVENMRRCMSNNYSLQQFWRDWHCSYNKWLVRYVYIPLGGRQTSTWNTFVVFTFVALWHDLSMRLLQWAWLIALLFLPEAMATWFFSRPQWSSKPYFRFLCSLGGAVNIIAMMVANLVGFGDDSVAGMMDKIFSRKGAVFLAVTYLLLNVHLQVMFELRAHEYRKEYNAASNAEAPGTNAGQSGGNSDENTTTVQWQMSELGSAADNSGTGSRGNLSTTDSGVSSPHHHAESLTKRQRSAHEAKN
ncbi:glycerol transporter [Coemansia sp. RSA 1813]|nr:glycerol transporter [Coemansia sp. RSA 1843]KAJ2093649.1 glycerol transporter [Coemansia sp. RSA 986]KAJ2217862.1 glycerol transporter [Coemansia sp. RSA 487]KAJ2562609.1 glycerol transporter [Coemansia sp. RSA 1813]